MGAGWLVDHLSLPWGSRASPCGRPRYLYVVPLYGFVACSAHPFALIFMLNAFVNVFVIGGHSKECVTGLKGVVTGVVLPWFVITLPDWLISLPGKCMFFSILGLESGQKIQMRRFEIFSSDWTYKSQSATIIIFSISSKAGVLWWFSQTRFHVYHLTHRKILYVQDTRYLNSFFRDPFQQCIYENMIIWSRFPLHQRPSGSSDIYCSSMESILWPCMLSSCGLVVCS